MWGLETINELNREAGDKAREEGKQPLRLSPSSFFSLTDVAKLGGFPNLGDSADDVDEKHERIDTLFCDSSGFGGPGEPALTRGQLEGRVEDLLEEHGDLLFGVVETGQFQLHMGVWKPVE